MSVGVALLAGAVATIVAALLGFVAALKRLSGRVATSEAADLWEESRSIRQDYAERIKELNAVVEGLAAKVEELEGRNVCLYRENAKLARIVEEHERTIAVLRKENGVLKGRLSELENGP